MNLNSAYEMAIWRAKESPAENRKLIVDKANQGLRKLEGFVGRTIYQSVHDPQLLCDWVEWNTAENALQAAKDMMTVPELKDFVGLIEKTEVFEHYSVSDYHQMIMGEAAVVELVVYQLNVDGDINAFKEAYSRGISQAKGYHNRYVLENNKGGNQWAEFVFWKTTEDAQQASKMMMSDPQIATVFQMIKEIKMVHQYFKVFK